MGLYRSSEKKKGLEGLSIPVHQLVSFSLDLHETPYVGYLYLTDVKEDQQQFLEAAFRSFN